MKKKILSLLIILAVLFMQHSSYLSFEGQKEHNPFANLDAVRNTNIQISLIDPKQSEKLSKNLAAYELKDADITDAHTPVLDFSDTYVVQFKKTASYTDIYNCVSNFEFDLLADSSERVFSIVIGDLGEFYNLHGNIIDHVEEIKQRQTCMAANDPLFSQQWAIPALNLPEAWQITAGDEKVLVGVIDTGLYRNHEDFNQSSILGGYDFGRYRPGVSSDPTGHGTAVTSIIAAHSNNNLGMTGASWNVSIIPYNVERSDKTIYSSDVIKAIRMAADAGCDIINISLGGEGFDQAEKDAVDYAISKGSIIIAAAGNKGYSTILLYPAAYKGVISVGSVNETLRRSSFSQVNAELDICAPGENIIAATSNPKSLYGSFSGTSFSAPYVSGIAALLKSIEDDMDWIFFEHLLKTTSTPISLTQRKNYDGWGLLNAQKILQAVENPIVIGVENNAIYQSGINILYNTGTALLNGFPFQSDTFFNKLGHHRLRVTSAKGSTTYVNFTICDIPLIAYGVRDGMIYNTDITVTFNHGTATLNSIPFESGTKISDEGHFTLLLEGPKGNLTTYNFEIDKTGPIVKGVENNKTYDRPVKIEFFEGTASLNGTTCTSGMFVSENGQYKLVVRDKAGNQTIIDFTVDLINRASKELFVAQEITQWVMSDDEKEIYAISFEGKSLMIIDAQDLVIKKQISLSHSPSHIIKDKGKLYFSLPDLKQIYEYDPKTGAYVSIATTLYDPFIFVKHNNLLFYVRNKFWPKALNEVDLETQNETVILHDTITSLAINSDLEMLYVGMSPSFRYYDILKKEFVDSIILGSKYQRSQKRIYYDGERVHYAGNTFNPEPGGELFGDYNVPETVIHSKNNLVFTMKSVYDSHSNGKIGDYAADYEFIEMNNNRDRLFIYNKTKKTIRRYDSASGSIDKDNILDLIGGVPYTQSVFSATGTRKSDIRTELEIGVSIDMWHLNDEQGVLYALSQNERALFVIDAVSLDILKTISFISEPMDFCFDDGVIYVTLMDAKKIQLIDALTYTTIKTIQTMSFPKDITKGNEIIYYTCDYTSNLYQLNLETGLESSLFWIGVLEKKIEINKYLNILYVADTTKIDYHHLTENWIKTNRANNTGFTRFFLDSDYLYLGGRAYDPADPDLIHGTYSHTVDIGFFDEIICTKGQYAFSKNAMYDKYSFKMLELYRSKVDLVEVSLKKDLYFYENKAKTIVRMLGERLEPPVVNGIENHHIYLDEISITFDKGTATLNGSPYISGSKVHEGTYTFRLREVDCDDIVINFEVYRYKQDDYIPVSFKDDKLKQALIENGVDKNGDGVITTGEMRILSGTLSLTDRDIRDLSGIEHAKNLRGIDLKGNKITDITPLSQLGNLRHLNLSHNNILEIAPLTVLTKLISLDLSNNKISFLDGIDKLLYLKSLNLSDNEIGSIDHILFFRLFDLDISNNFLVFSKWSCDALNVQSLKETNVDIIYHPQKSKDDVPAPTITLLPYTTVLTNQDITVVATTDRGRLNTAIYTFTGNGNFAFIASDAIGNETVFTVTITNIDKIPPRFILKSNHAGIASGSSVFADVAVSYADENIDEKSLKVYKDSRVISWPANGIFKHPGAYSLSIQDKAGNSSSVSFSISMLGDSNNDSVVDVTDILRIRAHIIGKTTLPKGDLDRSDVNRDGKIDVTDILLIRAIILNRTG